MSANPNSIHDPSLFAPAPAWSGSDTHAHVVQFYTDDAALLEELGKFLGAALGAGDAAIVIATQTHRDGLARLLKSCGLDIALATRQGRYIALDAQETLSKFMVKGMPDRSRFSQVIGRVMEKASAAGTRDNARAAAFGEMVALLFAGGNPDAAIQLEQLWNGLAQKHSFHLHCAYPMADFYQQKHGEIVQKICAEHSSVIPTEAYTSLGNEEDRLRAIAVLQQKAQALENEIMERRHAEQALRESEARLRMSEERLRLAQKAGRIGSWELDLNTEEYIWSDDVFEMFGLSPNVSRPSHNDFLSLLYFSTDRENIEKALKAARTRNKEYNAQFRIRLPNGQVRWIAARGRPYYNQGHDVMLGVFIDITDEQEAALAKDLPKPKVVRFGTIPK